MNGSRSKLSTQSCRSLRPQSLWLIDDDDDDDEVADGINRNNAQPDFIPSCENLIGNNLI